MSSIKVLFRRMTDCLPYQLFLGRGGHTGQVVEYVTRVSKDTSCAHTVIMKWVYDGTPGLLVATSKLDSQWVLDANINNNFFSFDEYQKYEAYFYPGGFRQMVFSAVGYVDAEDVVHYLCDLDLQYPKHIGPLQSVLEATCDEHGIPYVVLYDDGRPSNLQRLLKDLGIDYCLHIMERLSKVQFKGLDVYTKVLWGTEDVRQWHYVTSCSHEEWVSRKTPEHGDWRKFYLLWQAGSLSHRVFKSKL